MYNKIYNIIFNRFVQGTAMREDTETAPGCSARGRIESYSAKRGLFFSAAYQLRVILPPKAR
ncbi:hypothetical protein GA0116948_101235 [Chitinophaga costaii]|uniref:Uncharacterized protein n=1 Tax=Chitinophaga costaii TaxID=1335309 RepID=A0A1C3Z4E1_9BACT|nr:hypothetical protein GA0116948_101235 [Chitinophaga costaii]